MPTAGQDIFRGKNCRSSVTAWIFPMVPNQTKFFPAAAASSIPHILSAKVSGSMARRSASRAASASLLRRSGYCLPPPVQCAERVRLRRG